MSKFLLCAGLAPLGSFSETNSQLVVVIIWHKGPQTMHDYWWEKSPIQLPIGGKGLFLRAFAVRVKWVGVFGQLFFTPKLMQLEVRSLKKTVGSSRYVFFFCLLVGFLLVKLHTWKIRYYYLLGYLGIVAGMVCKEYNFRVPNQFLAFFFPNKKQSIISHHAEERNS